jgi:hypothetical protein
MLLESRMHSYLDPILRFQCGLQYAAQLRLFGPGKSDISQFKIVSTKTNVIPILESLSSRQQVTDGRLLDNDHHTEQRLRAIRRMCG